MVFHLSREASAQADDMIADGVGRTFADLPRRFIFCPCGRWQVDAAHARLRTERNKGRAQRMDVAFAQAEFFLGQHDDAAAFRRFIGQRGQLRRVGQLSLGHAAGMQEVVGLAVAQRDRAGLVQQQHIHIARRFHRTAGGGDHVLLQHAPHACHADGGKQGAYRGRDQAHQQRHQHGDADRRTRLGHLDAVQRERQQRDDHKQEDQRQRHQQYGQRDLVGRLLALGAFHHRDHAIQESLARIGGDAHHQPVGQHPRAAGYRAEVAAGFAYHRRALAGDGAFIHRGDALDHLAVAGNEVARLHQHHIVLAQAGTGHQSVLFAILRAGQFLGLDIALGLAHGSRLGAAAAFGDRLGEVGEQHGEPQPQRHGQDEAGRRFAVSAQRLEEQQRRQYAADPHHEHHRVLHLLLRTQFLERVHHGLFDDVALKQGKRNCLACHINLLHSCRLG